MAYNKLCIQFGSTLLTVVWAYSHSSINCTAEIPPCVLIDF